MLTEPPLVGPDAVRTTVGIHALTGIEDDNLVDVAVTIPVVLTPVNRLRHQRIDDVVNHILRVFVVKVRAAILIG